MRFRIAFAAGITFLSMTSLALAEKPPFEALRKIAIALGSAAADFEACGDKYGPDEIKYGFEAAIVGCVYRTPNDGKLEIVLDTARDQRRSDIQDAGGGYCKGDNKARMKVVTDQIKRIESSCDGND